MKRSQINAFIEQLGHDPKTVRSITFRPDEIRITHVKGGWSDDSWVIREYRYGYENEIGPTEPDPCECLGEHHCDWYGSYGSPETR